MSISVLVGYVTRYGSTQGVAEVVTTVLRENGLEVNLERLKNVRSVQDYSAVVLGAPLYIGALPGDVKHFLTEQQAVLAERPLAVFALGPLTREESERRGAREQLDKELAKYPALKPLDAAVFGGVFDPKKLRFPDNLLTLLPASPLYKRPASDERDWTAIQTWASDLAGKFKVAKTG